MDSNKMDKRVIFERNVSSSVDAHNRTTETWQKIAAVWADVRPLKGDEILKLEREVATEVIKLFIRYDARILGSDRVRYNGKYWNITYLREIPRQEGIEVLAELMQK